MDSSEGSVNMITEGQFRLRNDYTYNSIGADHTLYAAEASLYDRQIRLWGLEAQNRYAAELQ
jgi:hypothetical protein